MLVKLDPTLDIGAIIDSWHEQDQYDKLGQSDYVDEDAISDILGAIKNRDMSLMELMHVSQQATDQLWVSFIPVNHGFIDGHGLVKLTNPTLLFCFDDVACDLAIVEMSDHYWITLEYIS